MAKSLLFVNTFFGGVFWFITLTDFEWKKGPINYVCSGGVVLLSILTILYLGRNKTLLINRRFWYPYLFITLTFSVLFSAYLLDSDPYANDDCDQEYTNYYIYLLSLNGDKRLVMCDVFGPSGIVNVQIHYASFPFIKRELVIWRDTQDNNNIYNFHSSYWINDYTLFTQDPNKLDMDKMIKLNVWWPHVYFKGFFSAIVYFITVLVAYEISKLIVNLRKKA